MNKKYQALVIGASAGGINVLKKILSEFPASFNLPILIVHHCAKDFDNEYFVKYLREFSKLIVKEADDKELIKAGFVYLAPPDYHLLIENDQTISLAIDDKVCYSRPSINILFESAAEVFKDSLIALILTGANDDGMQGLKKIKAYNGFTIAQDPASCEFPIMPESAIKEGCIDKIISLDLIVSWLLTYLNYDKE